MSDWIEINNDVPSEHRSKWLIIDESTFVLSQFREVVKALPIKIFEARDLVAAMEVVNFHDDLDLILCDVNLLRINGHSPLLELIKKKQSDLPIYLLSIESKVDLVADAQKFGAIGWMTKPPVFKDLAALFEKLRHA